MTTVVMILLLIAAVTILKYHIETGED